MIVAGEASGDIHGAELVRALLKRDENLRIFGVGGERMRDAGVELKVHIRDLSVMGITEVLWRLNAVRKSLAAAKALLSHRPRLLILIDFPDFNLRIAARAKRLGIPILYYISPKIWAWRRGRINIIKRLVDRMAVILPFEKHFYQQHGVPVTFVGNPVMDLPEYRDIANYQKDDSPPLTIGMLPGSRHMEIKRHLPILLDTARLIHRKRPETRFLFSLPRDNRYREMVCNDSGRFHREITSAPVSDIFRKCHMVASASGTVCLEAAVCGIPMVVFYKVSPVSYRIGKLLIRTPYVSLVNLTAGAPVVKELLQDKAHPAHLAYHLMRLINSPANRMAMREKLMEVRQKLGKPGASERVADLAFSLMFPSGCTGKA